MPAALPASVRTRALHLLEKGWSLRAIGRELGVHHTTVAWWRDGGGAGRALSFTIVPPSSEPGPVRDAWAYLFGLYLGDGYIDPLGRLRFFLDKAYPGIVAEALRALATLGCPNPRKASQPGCWALAVPPRSWPFWLPTGDGRKHEYPLVLQHWHRAAIEEVPHLVARGLIHSDGCRFINVVTVNGRSYRYATYDFANRSASVHRIYRACLERLDIRWKAASRGRSTRVNRRDDVAILDLCVGPKS